MPARKEIKTKEAVVANNTEAKPVEPNTTMTQEEYVNAKIEEAINAKMAKVEENKVSLGVMIESKDIAAGSPRTNPDGSPMLDAQTGGIKYWQDSYYLKASFRGGEMDIKTTKEVYDSVGVGRRYLAVGRIVMVNPKEGRAYPKPEFNEFQRLF